MENNVQTAPANTQIPDVLTPQQALNLLVQGINYAQTKGVFSLKDAALLDKAITVFSGPAPEAEQDTTVQAPATPTVEPTTDVAQPTV